ncbi:hypothetical protein RvY_14203 [Ramazzottius varieornatus]|uniref:Uncharacterized protein n=1 Tax=Ramazzottius varieornatus TaxID=947166 RepID=A0A1D1VQH2_RAMVA|nr:hypothetical protein RvY_14203 [Ramazzottius varieornatus]
MYYGPMADPTLKKMAVPNYFKEARSLDDGEVEEAVLRCIDKCPMYSLDQPGLEILD